MSHVNTIISCSEPRVTVVNSYMSRNPFALEKTRYDTFKHELTCDYEFALHKAWRVREQLKSLMLIDNEWPTKEELVDRLQLAIKELTDCKDLIAHTATDSIGYYNEEKKKLVHYDDDFVRKDLPVSETNGVM